MLIIKRGYNHKATRVFERIVALLRPKLSGTLFQKDLGTLLDKATRVEALVVPLAQATGLEAANPGEIKRY